MMINEGEAKCWMLKDACKEGEARAGGEPFRASKGAGVERMLDDNADKLTWEATIHSPCNDVDAVGPSLIMLFERVGMAFRHTPFPRSPVFRTLIHATAAVAISFVKSLSLTFSLITPALTSFSPFAGITTTSPSIFHPIEVHKVDSSLPSRSSHRSS